MKAVAFNGSPRKDGNTSIILRAVLKEIEAEGIGTELVQLGGQPIRGCAACYACFETKDCRCAIKNDILNDCVVKMLEADAIILGSPVYFADVTAEIKALIDRAGLVAKANGELFKRKIGAGVLAVRRAGSTNAFDTMNHFFLIGQMIVPGSCYWNMAVGRNKGEVETDEEGMRTMRTLGQNVAWLMKKLKG